MFDFRDFDIFSFRRVNALAHPRDFNMFALPVILPIPVDSPIHTGIISANNWAYCGTYRASLDIVFLMNVARSLGFDSPRPNGCSADAFWFNVRHSAKFSSASTLQRQLSSFNTEASNASREVVFLHSPLPSTQFYSSTSRRAEHMN
jgi:hypothetical protein